MRVGERLIGHDAEVGVGVLGPATIGAQSATPRQRALIAALALAGDRGAAIDELADGVWGGRPPSSARASLQNQMTRLRRMHGDDLIVCEYTRYRLGRTTDVDVFERVVAGARSAPAAAATIDSLAGALGLWRGTPYDDLADSHAAEIERARLTQLRGRAADLLAIGRIRIRDYEQCIVELRVEVEDDPYRDRAWELLFVALQRAGRTGEALAAHRVYVERLREQFGSEPSDALTAVGRALRSGSPLELVSEGISVQIPTSSSEAVCGHDPMGRRCRSRGHRRTRRVDP
ncbi:MAG: BTAD domain-containing putative transcriptional regulator [Acidimicrobiales bacterium]